MKSVQDKWININPKSKTIYLRFRVKGFDKQFHLSTGLRDTKSNRARVESLIAVIENDIFMGEFDSTLHRYRKFSTAAQQQQQQKTDETITSVNLIDVWDRFTAYQSTQLELSTIKSTYNSIKRYIKKFPTHSLDDAGLIRDWLLANTTKFMTHFILRHLAHACEWALINKIITENTFKNFKISPPKKKFDEEDYRAFTREQRDIIISAFEQHQKLSHYSSLIKFLFWSGCRPGEAFALRWSDISLDCRQISISKSRNRYHITKGTKTGKKRIFPCTQGSKLHNLLLELRASSPQADEYVFVSKKGTPLNEGILTSTWNKSGTTVNKIRITYLGVVRELFEAGKIPYYLKPYATRHTFATWAIASGVSPDKVAYWMGDSVETILKFYVHPDVTKAECPDF